MMHYRTGVEAGSQEVGKRKREDDMAALEAAVTHTRLPGFVSGGTVQPDRSAAEADANGGAADTQAAAGGCFSFAMCMPSSRCMQVCFFASEKAHFRVLVCLLRSRCAGKSRGHRAGRSGR